MVQKIAGASWTIKQGDFGIDKVVIIQNSDGTPRDLTTLNAMLILWIDVPTNQIILEQPLSITDPTNGVVTWSISSANTALLNANVYNAEIRLTDNSSTYQEDTATFTLNVLESS
jgi:BppU N-terminal domain